MRIVYITPYFMPYRGYSEYYLAEKQKEVGHEVCIATSDRREYRSPVRTRRGLFTEEGIEVLRLPSLQFLNEPLLSMKGLREFLSHFSPEIVHVMSVASPFSVIPIALWKYDLGYEIVTTGPNAMYMSKGFTLSLKLTLLEMYKRSLMPIVKNRIGAFSAISEASINWLRDNLYVDQEKIHFIPLGADSSLFYPDHYKGLAVRENLRIEKDTVVAIYTGKLFPHKSIDKLITACAPLFEAYDFKLLLVGGGSKRYLSYLIKLIAEMQINDYVIFHQWVHRTELPDYYNAADFAVWPAHHSISILEAMSTGLPVVIPRSKWLNHLLEYENGFEHSEGDVEELRTYLRKLILDKKRRNNMGHRSRQLIEDKLNWKVIARRHLELYEEIIHDQRKKG